MDIHARRPANVLWLAATLLTTLLAGTAAASGETLTPRGGAHWRAGAGLADRTGGASQALVYQPQTTGPAPSGPVVIAEILGFEGTDVAGLGSFGFAVGANRGTILPCVRIAYRDSSGRAGELMIHPEDMRQIDDRSSAFTSYSYEGPFPDGVITTITLEVHVSPASVMERANLALDDIAVGGHLWTSAADNAGAS